MTVCDDEAGVTGSTRPGGGHSQGLVARLQASPPAVSALGRGFGARCRYDRRMAEAPVTSLAEQIEELGTQLAWVRDYL